MIENDVLTLLGFAQKAGKLAAGEAAVDNFLKKKRIYLLVASNELSENRCADWKQKAEEQALLFCMLHVTKSDLGRAIGLSPRGIVGVMDQKMAEAIMKKVEK